MHHKGARLILLQQFHEKDENEGDRVVSELMSEQSERDAV